MGRLSPRRMHRRGAQSRPGSALGAEGAPADPDVQQGVLDALCLACRAHDAPPLPPGAHSPLPGLLAFFANGAQCIRRACHASKRPEALASCLAVERMAWVK